MTGSHLVRCGDRLLLILASAAVFAAAPAAAQLQGPLLGSEFSPPSDRGRNTSVLERERPDYEAPGIREGAFLIYPKVVVGGGYSSNVYGLKTDKADDAFLAVDPSVFVESQWGTHALNLEAGGRLRRFADETPKNESGYFARANGRLDIDRATSYEGGTSIEKQYEQRSSGSFPVEALASIPFYRTNVYGRFTRQGGRIRGIVAADYNHLAFDNVRALGGGILNQEDRDRSVVRVTGRGDYAVTPDIAAFGQASYSTIDYERRLSNGLGNRDGDEFRIAGGSSFDLTALIRGEIGVGYVRRTFDSGIYPDFSGVAVDATIEYFASQLTTVSARARRTVEDSNIVGSGGYFSNVASIGVDHELLRNILLNARLDYEIDDFNGIDRRDKVFSANAGVRYFMNRNVGVAFDAGYTDRNSDDPRQGIEYDEFHGAVSLILQL